MPNKHNTRARTGTLTLDNFAHHRLAEPPPATHILP